MRKFEVARRPISIVTVAAGIALALAGSALAAPGDLDPDFGEGGYLQTDFGSQTRDGGGDVIVRSDGSIVVAASTEPAAFAMIGYTETGDLDPNFGSGGIVKIIPPLGGSGSHVVEQPDGKLVMAGGVSVQQGEGTV